ncbi:MAG: molybdopterin-dependent oxidoreductase [Paenibacillaceae bacterium]
MGSSKENREVQAVKRKIPWLSMKYAQKLKKLHAWNGWLVLLLTITGILLFLPAFRLAFPQTRVWTKELHIYLGLVSLLPLLMYTPMIVKHMKQIRGRSGQKWNLRIVLIIIVSWAVSGLILWQFRQFPPRLNNAALLVHDLFSWVGIPYIVFHSLTRMRWVKRADFKPSIERVGVAGTETGIGSENGVESQPRTEAGPQDESTAVASVATAPTSMLQRLREEAKSNHPKVPRRIFIQWVLALFLVVSVGPSFYRWIKRSFDTGGSALDDIIANPDTPVDPLKATNDSQMIPAPQPLPDSNPPIGGGAKGNFRIYTVTEMPDSRAETWSFEIAGLVNQPLTYNWDQFMELPREVQVSNFHCVTGWSVYNCTWEGIKLSDLMDLSGVKPTAKHVKFYSGDGVYTDTLTLKQAHLEDVMVVCLLDGKPIPKQLGGPVRLIVPQMYTYKSVKWLQGIELTEKEEDGYWIVRGYDKDAWVTKGVTDNL